MLSTMMHTPIRTALTTGGPRLTQLRPRLPLARDPHGRSATGCTVAAGGPDGPRSVDDQIKKDNSIVFATAASLTAITILGAKFFPEAVEDLLYSDAMSDSNFGAGDIVGGLLWSYALYYTSPLQLLLIFLGDVDSERPSDRIIRLLGQITGQPVDDIDYTAPGVLRALTVAICVVTGFLVAYVFEEGLGDATWSVATGLGTCMAGAIYEVGRPTRLSTEEALVLQDQWEDFAAFATTRLQRVGRCHESEVYKEFRTKYPKYRSEEVISDSTLRDMIRNYHPEASRTPNGYYKNLSIIARVDAFTGETVGTAKLPVTTTSDSSSSSPPSSS